MATNNQTQTGTTPSTVAGGGSGRSSATAYAVICGGTTATGPEQSIASVGTSGQVLTSNGAGNLPTFQNTIAVANAFNSMAVQTFAASGTYTPTTGMKYCTIELVGAGGGGGGAASNGALNSSAAGGGGAGGYASRTFSSTQVGASATVTIGAAGAAGAAGNNTGGTGGNTSIALTGTGTITMTGNGGAGGVGGPTSATGAASNGGAGGTATNGNVNVTGNPGDKSFALGATVGTTDGGFGGNGGSGIFGAGAPTTNGFNATVAGSVGTGKGSGGSGAVVMRLGTQQAGGAGTAGFLIVTEYIST